jgi:hypothetical protein
MLPPIDEAVLQNNPEFAGLYSKLTTSVFNPDGSTKNPPAAKERRMVSEVGCTGEPRLKRQLDAQRLIDNGPARS